jgi:glycosyltransferase involved in cell wall biosynthesis
MQLGAGEHAQEKPGSTMNTQGGTGAPDLSVVAPAHNEEENIAALVREVAAALRAIEYEFIIVDDGSTDSTRAKILAEMAANPRVRCVAMTRTPPGKGNGQSAAFHAGFRAARGPLIAVLDADLQNDPRDLPMMLDTMRRTGADMIQGDRSHARKDTIVRRYGSIVGRVFRRLILGDSVRDTGCSLRVMKREFALGLPLEFRGMHRFIPVGVAHQGGKVVEVQVNHRPRAAGTTKYGAGLKRAIPGLVDCFAVRYMKDRRRPTENIEVIASASPRPAADGVAPQIATPRPASREVAGHGAA